MNLWNEKSTGARNSACNDGQTTGVNAANYIIQNSFLRLHGK